MTKIESVLLIACAFLIVCLLEGCIGPIAAGQLSVEQINALKEYNGDIFGCLAINGPPAGGGGTFLLVPKGVKPDVTFTGACQIQNGKIQ